MNSSFGFLLILLTIIPAVVLAETKKQTVRTMSHLIRTKANSPEPLRIQPEDEQQLLRLSYKEILALALSKSSEITTLRGTISAHERIDSILQKEEQIAIIADQQNVFLQWLPGDNYGRKVLYQKNSSTPGLIWVMEPTGIWNRLHRYQMNKDSDSLLPGLQMRVFQNLQPGFWFYNIFKTLNHHTEQQMVQFKPIKQFKMQGEEILILTLISNVSNSSLMEIKPDKIHEIWLKRKNLVLLKMVIHNQDQQILKSYFFSLTRLNDQINPDEFHLERFKSESIE